MNAAPYRIVIARSAAAAIAEQLPESVASAIVELITGALAEAPRRVGTPLRDDLEGKWTARRGTYRVVYRIDDMQREIVVLRVAHRRDAYRSLGS
ncbi:type II toxin-antitoxin system RelE family toxin [Candidatus Poriferisodalis sp.]|uniref:type II toxin-antitoxin system RelE family toxin n=1 Tax=Candidatus Poriferisodalis sp. TaxID=3101277 RepID=UPI003AF5D744